MIHAYRPRYHGHGHGYYPNGYGHSRYGWERGLNDRHYVDANRREREYNHYLSDREKNLRRRMNNLSKRDERLMRKPNNGRSREVLSGTKNATVLHTYVPLPVNPKKEIGNLLASYR